MTDTVVAALYKFVDQPHYADLREPLLEVCVANDVKGTLLLASEGINGTIAGSRSGIDAVLAHIRSLPDCANLVHKVSHANDNPFLRMKVRLKKEIVTMGVPGTDPRAIVGTYVKPEDWNELISAPDVITIDTRNDYEVKIGSFEGAIDPKTTTFREFPAWFREFRKDHANTRVAMYCTGGIRCEKSTAFLKNEGVDEVYHLEGGILKYLEEVPEEESLWHGECFVFDQRVSVGHGLALGSYDQCHACRMPISDEDKRSEFYILGTSCPHCHDTHSTSQMHRFAERQKQMDLAEHRGCQHLGETQKKG